MTVATDVGLAGWPVSSAGRSNGHDGAWHRRRERRRIVFASFILAWRSCPRISAIASQIASTRRWISRRLRRCLLRGADDVAAIGVGHVDKPSSTASPCGPSSARASRSGAGFATTLDGPRSLFTQYTVVASSAIHRGPDRPSRRRPARRGLGDPQIVPSSCSSCRSTRRLS